MIPHSKPTIGPKDKAAILEVLQTGMIARGTKVAEFESAVANYLGLEGGVATSSGTAALVLALKSLDINRGDEVIIPTYVCHDVLDAVIYTGAIPVLCDVGNNNWNMDYYTVRPHLSPKTKAIIVVHIFGIAANIEAITQLGVPVIEDIAQAFGTEINKQKVGTFGQITMCSFQATKCLTTGEGGMLLSNDSHILEKAIAIQSLFPMSDIQAALGISQLERYDTFLGRRREIASTYFKTLDKLPNVCMPTPLRQRSIFFRFPIRIQRQFDTFKNEFEQLGISVRRGVDSLLHRGVGLPSKDFPNAEQQFSETLSIPIYPALTDDEVEYITQASQQIL
jgi:UDP-4-amino-4-deoxy-L-arabinose-oxoglutarate aminotransferase